MKVVIISALAGLCGLATLAVPWLEAGSAPVQRAQCVVVTKGGNNPPYLVVCPTANPV